MNNLHIRNGNESSWVEESRSTFFITADAEIINMGSDWQKLPLRDDRLTALPRCQRVVPLSPPSPSSS